jgi:hypothetical protein
MTRFLFSLFGPFFFESDDDALHSKLEHSPSGRHLIRVAMIHDAVATLPLVARSVTKARRPILLRYCGM